MGSNNRLRRAYYALHEQTEINRGIEGQLGKIVNGAWIIDISERPGWVYVGCNDGSRNMVIEALDSGVSRIGGLPVRLYKMADGEFEVKAYGARTASYLGPAARLTGNVPYHSHQPGTGLDDYVTSRRFEYGLVHATDPVSMSVQIEPFYYDYGGDEFRIEQSTFDLTSYQSVSSGMWQWIKIGYDPAAEEFVAVEGTEYSVLSPLNEADLPGISMAGYISLGAVRLRWDDSNIPEIDGSRVARYADIRRFFGGADVLGDDRYVQLAAFSSDAIVRLATVAAVNLNTSTPTTLYTVPAGKTAIITHVVLRLASTSLTTVSLSIGWNSASFNDVIANATHTELTGNTLYTGLDAKAGAAIGAAASVLKLLCNTLQGGAATITVDVFGYLY